MAQTVLEELIVKMVGDNKEYVAMLTESVAKTEEAYQELKKKTEQAESQLNSVSSAVSAIAAGLAALGAGAWLREAFGEWSIAETTALKLESAIRANGRAVEPLMDQYREFASELQNLTVIGDDATLAVLAQAESFDISGQSAVAATRNATALAAINGGSAGSYLRLTAAIERGDTELAMRMARMVPQLRGIKDETEFLDRANRLFSSGMAAAAAEAGSASGRLAQLKNSYGDLMEDFGRSAAETVAPLVSMLKDLVTWFQSLSRDSKDLIVTMAMTAASMASLIATLTALRALYMTLAGSILGAKIALIAFGAVLAFNLITHVTGVRDLNREMERSAELARSLNRTLAQRQNRAIEELPTDPERRRPELAAMLATAETEANTLRQRQTEASTRLEALRAPSTTLTERFSNYDEILRLVDQVDHLGTALEGADTRAEELRVALRELDREAIARGQATYENMGRAIQDETDAIGMSREQMELHRAARAGMNEEMLASLSTLQELRLAREEEDRIEQQSSDILNQLAEQYENITQAQRAANEARDAGRFEEADEIERAEGLVAGERWMQTLRDRREALIRQVDPMENYNRQVRELNELMDNPETALTEEQRARAMAQYAAELNNTASAADRAREAVQGFQAVAAGSSASLQVLDDYVRGTRVNAGRGGEPTPVQTPTQFALLGPLAPLAEGISQLIPVLRQLATPGLTLSPAVLTES